VIKQNKRRISGDDGFNNLVEFAWANEAGGIRLLTALDEGDGNGRSG
jgi:hypothetical protein